MSFISESLKTKAVQLVGGLFMEKKDDKWVISTGRVSWWLAFIPAVYIWLSGNGSLDPLKDIAPNHLNILLTLAGYNFSKHAIKAFDNILGKS